MKRLISILVVIAMMLALVATSIPAFATEGDGEGEAAATPLATYNVNWKELVDNGTMRSQWLYDRDPGHNDMPTRYAITATETALDLALRTDGDTDGDHRQYYSDIMFPLTADTQYVYELEAKSSGNNGGIVIAYSEDNPKGRDENDSKTDFNGDDVDYMASAYIIMGKLTTEAAQLKFGGYWPNYGYENEKNLSQAIENAKLTEDGYAKYKVVYTGFTVEIFYLDTNDAWVELYADATITLADNAKLAFGVYTNGPNFGVVRNCVVYGMNEAAKNYMVLDRAPLASAINDAKALKEIDYTPDSWAVFSPEAIEAAEAAYKAVTNQVEVNEAIAALQAAIDALVESPVSDKTALNAAIAAAKALNPEDYAATSQAKLAAAIAAAETTAAEEINVNVENAAVAALNAVIAGLIDKDFTATAYYNVNWKALVDNGTMRGQWAYDRTSAQNNFTSKYTVTATETGLSVKDINGGDSRQYYSDIMFEITDSTYFEYIFEVENKNYADAGVVFAWAADPDAYIGGRNPKDDAAGDVFPGLPKSSYYIKGNFSNGSNMKIHFGAPNDGYAVFGTSTAAKFDNMQLAADSDAEGAPKYTTFKVIYDGRNVTIYYMNNEGQYVQAFADKTITLPEISYLAFGLACWSPDYTNIRNCKITAYNAPAADAIAKAPLEYSIMVANKLENKAANYTPNTFNPMIEALADAKAALAAGEGYAEAAEALDAAIAALKKPADKKALDAKIAEVEAALAEGEYTAVTKAAVETALAAAKGLSEDANISADDQANINKALADLEYAFARLTVAGQANKIDLIIAIEKYEALVETDFTPESWPTAKVPYYAAKVLQAKELVEADQADIDAATAALNAAINALVARADFSKLQVLVNRVDALDNSFYAPETLIAEELITAAKEVLANLDATQTAVDEALAALQAAYDALKPIRTNVLLITVPDDYVIHDQVSYPPATATEYNKITDMSYHGLGNVFYYDYHKVIANVEFSAGWKPGDAFEKSMKEMNMQGDASYVLRLSTINGSASNRGVDGIKVKDSDNFSHQARPTIVNGTQYSHVFGYSFREAPTFDSVAFYLPTNTSIVSIDVYAANREFDENGNVLLYGKADADKVTELDASIKLRDESDVSAQKVYLGTVTVPAAEAGAENILAQADLMAFEAEYVYFAINYKEGTTVSDYYTIYEVELYGFNAGDENLKADFSALNALFADIAYLNEADYTPLSWKGLTDAIAKHDATIMSALSTQEAVDAAVADIDAAIKALAYAEADFAALEEMLTVAKLFEDSADAFTPGTFKALTDAIKAAEELKEIGAVPQSLVDAATAALFAAIAELDEAADKSALEETIKKADTYKKDEWQGNVIAWNMFEKALNEAKAIFANVDAVQEEIDAAVKSVEAKILELQATPGVTPGQPGDEPGQPGDEPGDKPGEPGESETDPVESETDPVESETDPVETESDTESDTKATETEPEEEGGCGSSIALSALAVVGVIGTAVVLKKKED